jgi:nucleoside-diphosphate-sugar epimerase
MGKKKVVVAGAAGSLGSKIVKELIAQGAEVTAMVWATSNREKLTKLGVSKFVIGDMMDNDSLHKALTAEQRFDAIVASAAGYTRHTKGDNEKTDNDEIVRERLGKPRDESEADYIVHQQIKNQFEQLN